MGPEPVDLPHTETSNLCWEIIADDQKARTIRQVAWAHGPEELEERVRDEATDITLSADVPPPRW